jgi:DNA-binding MarR family transcriptional regulator
VQPDGTTREHPRAVIELPLGELPAEGGRRNIVDTWVVTMPDLLAQCGLRSWKVARRATNILVRAQQIRHGIIRRDHLHVFASHQLLAPVVAERGVALDLRAIAICEGDLAAAITLCQIAYWMPRARIKLHDGFWLAKPVKQLATETGLSERTTRRAVDRLVALGFVSKRVRRWRGVARLHLRITNSVAAALQALDERGLNPIDQEEPVALTEESLADEEMI